MTELFKKLGVLNDDSKASITNLAVMIFCFICAFRSFFPGLEFHTSFFTWKVEPIDIASTLPMLFALLNYSHKRSVLTTNNTPETTGKDT